MLPAAQVIEGDLLHVLPSLQFVEQLTPKMRAHIYSELGKLPANEYCMDPVLITGTSVQEWYRTSKLRKDLVDKIEQLSYMRGETIAFSDIPALLNYAQLDSEARAIFKACTRTRSLMVRLKIDETPTSRTWCPTGPLESASTTRTSNRSSAPSPTPALFMTR